MVKEAKAANIKVILGMEPSRTLPTDPQQLDSDELAHRQLRGGAIMFPVINYEGRPVRAPIGSGSSNRLWPTYLRAAVSDIP